MKLYIDNQLCLTDALTTSPTIGFDTTDLRSFDALRAGRRYKLSLPICRQNRQILGYDDRILAATSFNNTDHKARIEFDGVKNLPDDERWGLVAAAYPHAAFHSEEGSLCFEDRDSKEGLHRYFDAHYEELNSARRVTLSLQLSAADLLPIITTDPAGRDLRSVFRLTIGGEEALYRLEAIEEWREEECVARCRFVQLV